MENDSDVSLYCNIYFVALLVNMGDGNIMSNWAFVCRNFSREILIRGLKCSGVILLFSRA